VHGIWTEGRWQHEIAPVLYPHFEPASVKYGAYRFLGPLDLVFEPVMLVPGVAAWIAAWSLLWWHERLHLQTGAAMVILLVLVLIAAHLAVGIRLEKTVAKFLDECAPSILNGHAHVIGHSLGSYIVCTALQNDPTMFARRVVLAGCVVKTCFAWQNLTQGPERKVAAVRHEVAGRDWIPSAARFLSWRFRNFGSAGRLGFRGDANLVHTVQSPNQKCSACIGMPVLAPVHNFVSAKKGHSGVLKSTYTKYYWLPYFWEIDPSEFREFLDACFNMMKAFANAGSPSTAPAGGEFDRLADAFLQRPWSWTGGCAIPDFLARTGRPVPEPGNQKIVAYNMCLAVAEAEAALGAKVNKWRKDPSALLDYRSPEYDDVIKALYPTTALTRAYLVYKNGSKTA
jgi:pimeloyl-ACP methyl ester carboxylesterase